MSRFRLHLSKARTALGINLIELVYTNASCPFNNLIHGHINQVRLDPFSGSIIPLNNSYLDANRWPNSLPPGGANGGPYIVRYLSYPTSTGDYAVTWSGDITAMFTTTGAGTATLHDIDYVARTAVLTVGAILPGAAELINLYYTWSGGTHPTNLSVVKVGATGTFNSRFLADLARFKGIRFVKWNPEAEGNLLSGNQTAWAGGTSSSPTRLILWASRNTAVGGDWLTNDGVPIEIMVQLANEVYALNPSFQYIHVNIPWNADDAWVTGIATYVRDNLNANIKCRFESSNEVWNPGYNVYFQAANEGQALGLPDRGHGGGRGWAASRYAMRIYEMMSLITTVFSGQLNRITRLCCCQHANPWESDEILGYMQTNGWLGYVDSLATAPYYSMSLGWGYTGNVQAVFDDTRSYIDTFLTPDAVTHKATSVTYGKPLTTYEAGPSYLFSDATYMGIIQRDERIYWMQHYYLDWLQRFYQTATLFAFEHPIAAVNAWGLKEYEAQTLSKVITPKFQAVIDYMAGA